MGGGVQLNRLARSGPRRYLPHARPRLRWSTALLLLGLLACGGEPPPVPQPGTENPTAEAAPSLDCGVTATTHVTENAIGDLAIGKPVSEILEACEVMRDTVEIRQEGQPARILTVNLLRDTVEAEVSASSRSRVRAAI